MQPSEATVFVVDDDQEVRDSLQALVQAMGFPVRVFATAAAFHGFYDKNMPGCLILDIRMPVQNGIELYQQLIAQGKRIPVIFITGHADVTTAVAAMKTGAIEFLEKPFDKHILRQLINKGLQLDGQWREKEREFAKFHDVIARLTDREKETLDLILAGKSNKQMAAELYLSERAIEMRRAAIMKKLNAKSIAELLDIAITHRVLSELQQITGQRHISIS